MAKEYEQLKITQKIIDMMLYTYPALKQFPKSEKHAMAADIKACMDRMLERSIEVDKHYFKKTTLRDLDVEVAKAKTYAYVAYQLQFLPERKFLNISDYLSEIGAMVGGFLQAIEPADGRRTKQ